MNLIRKRVLLSTISIALLCGNSAFAVTTVYDNVTDYLAATAPGFYLEDFDSFGSGDPGSPLSLGPVNGFSYEMNAVNGLFSGGGNMSTNTAFDPLTIDFTGATVTSVGGNFWLTDLSFLTEMGTLTIDLADGSATSVNLVDADPSTFRGFVTDGVPITSVTLTPVDPGDMVNRWSTVDNLYVGQVVPEPTTCGLLVIGLLSFLGLRRR